MLKLAIKLYNNKRKYNKLNIYRKYYIILVIPNETFISKDVN